MFETDEWEWADPDQTIKRRYSPKGLGWGIIDEAYEARRKYSKEIRKDYTPMTFFRNVKSRGLLKAVKEEIKLSVAALNTAVYAWPA